MSFTSQALTNFESSIKDAEELLAHFDELNVKPKSPAPESTEVLKRASLVMALTAWETYVEDRISEAVGRQLKIVQGSFIGSFVHSKLEQELKSFHNPTADKTRKLFKDYLGVDVTQGWVWQHMDTSKAKSTLDSLILKRGDAVHRSKPVNIGGPAAPHLVRKEELEKAIRFVKDLVNATDGFLALKL